MTWLYLFAVATLLLYSLPTTKAQTEFRPIRHTQPFELESIFGSDIAGSCNLIVLVDNLAVCNGTSVLNDGITPTVMASEDMWANRLFTMRRNGTEGINVTFELERGPNRDRVEFAVFNCPERGISAPSVSVYSDSTLNSPRTRNFIANKTLPDTSCNHLIKFCMDFTSTGLIFLTLEFPYQTNSSEVFLGEVTFLDGGSSPCDPPELINSTRPPPNAPTTTVTPTGTNNSVVPTDTTSEQATTSSGSPAANNEGATRTIIVVIVVVSLLVAIAIVTVVIVILMLYMRRRKRKREHDRVQQLQNVVMETKDGETEGNNHYDRAQWNGHESSGDVHPLDGMYSVVETKKNDMYNSLREEKRDLTQKNVAIGDDQYSKLSVSETKLLGSNPGRSPSPQVEPVSQNIADMYAVPNKNVADMYAVPDKTKRSNTSPAVPQKSTELVDYLDTKEAMQESEKTLESAPEYSEIGSAHSVAKSSVASHGMLNGMSSNPLYQPTDVSLPRRLSSAAAQSNAVGLDFNPIYAEPEAPTIHEPEWNPDQNIYESIYNEPLNPSLFMQKRESVNSEDLRPYSSIYSVPVLPTTAAKPLSVSASSIRELKHLGNGNFGQVVLAQTVGLSPKDLHLDGETPYTIVAVKKLKPSASARNRELFDKEVKFMSRLNHPNVIRLLGVCTDEDAPFIMMEYMTNGDLNQYLNGFHSIGEGDPKSISGSRLVYISTQIASAMHYLASQNFIHRDLATRNCLVGSKDTIKIADFGMSRSLYESQYYVISGHAILPIRWMATECFYGKFSAKTDVWAFGVTMWEIFTLAKDPPYDDMEDGEVVEDATKGANRMLLSRPSDCPENIYAIMRKCWRHEPSQRATFDKLHELLSST